MWKGIVLSASFLVWGSLAQGGEMLKLDLDLGALRRDFKSVVQEGPGPCNNVLALGVSYPPAEKLRLAISKYLGKSLKFFQGWNPSGEAHVTVITPVEFAEILQKNEKGLPLLSMGEIAQIADESKIQESDLAVLGIGHGTATLKGKTEETFFILVESMNLRRIRQKIYDRFIQKGGNPLKWNPQHFYPHITVGYTERDLHEADGVLKNMEHSFDARFELTPNPSR